jgi:hypothetical protein
LKFKDYIPVFILIAVIIIVIAIVVKKIKDAGRAALDTGQNLIASTPLGWLGGIRTVAGQEAANRVLNLRILKESFAVAINTKYNTPAYHLVYMGTSASNALAHQIVNANSLVPGGFFDDSQKALAAILQIKNQIQCLEVVHSYYQNVQKDLSVGLQWLSDDAMIQVYKHLSGLRTGAYNNGTYIKYLSAIE